MSLKMLLLSVIAATAAADTFYPEPALPLGWASQNSESTVLGRDAANMVRVTLAVRERNMDKIREIALDVSNPDSANYGQYLSQAQIDEITAPAAADVAAVRSWLNAEQFAGTVEEAQAGRTFVLTAPATAVGSLLKTTFRRVTNAATGQTTLRAASFVLPAAAGTAVTAVFGVHGLPLPPKRNLAAARSPPTVDPTVIASTYNVEGVTVDRLSGKNRQAVVEFFDYNGINTTDLATFFARYVQPHQAGDDVVSKFVGDNGTTSWSGGNAILNIEYIMGVAPGVKTEFWLFNGNDFCQDLKNWTDTLLATPDAPLVHSVTYGLQGNLTEFGCKDGNVASVDDNFSKLAAKGITIIIASGDHGSGYGTGRPTLWTSWPASSPWVTSVGATRFVGQKVGAEEMASEDFGSGGGFSKQCSRGPNTAWQNAMVADYLKNAPQLPPASYFPPLGRGTPDVSTLGEGIAVVWRGVPYYQGGTEASTPTFAALVSLLNEARLKANMPVMGFLNPFLYKNADAFFDVVKGNNAFVTGTNAAGYGFYCTKGWDPVTGLGTPHFGKLLAAATGLQDSQGSVSGAKKRHI